MCERVCGRWWSPITHTHTVEGRVWRHGTEGQTGTDGRHVALYTVRALEQRAREESNACTSSTSFKNARAAEGFFPTVQE